jgi:hypothetical protein
LSAAERVLITWLVQTVSEIGARLGAAAAQHAGLDEFEEHVKPEAVLDAIERQDDATAGGDHPSSRHPTSSW